jgi:hypothetical protein
MRRSITLSERKRLEKAKLSPTREWLASPHKNNIKTVYQPLSEREGAQIGFSCVIYIK